MSEHPFDQSHAAKCKAIHDAASPEERARFIASRSFCNFFAHWVLSQQASARFHVLKTTFGFSDDDTTHLAALSPEALERLMVDGKSLAQLMRDQTDNAPTSARGWSVFKGSA